MASSYGATSPPVWHERDGPGHPGARRAAALRTRVRRPARRDHHGLEVRHGRDEEGRRGPRAGRGHLRDPRHVGPPRPRDGRRLLQERADARDPGDHRGRRPVRRPARGGRRPHRPAGHRRAPDEPHERGRRPGRHPVDRADAAGGPGGVRRTRQPAQRGPPGRAHPRHLSEGPPPLELERPRDLGDLLTLSFNVFTRHFTPLFTLAMIVVTPYVLLIDGVWGRALAEGADARQHQGPTAVYVLVGFLVVQPLMAATIVRYLRALEEGRVLDVGAALRAGLEVVLPAGGGGGGAAPWAAGRRCGAGGGACCPGRRPWRGPRSASAGAGCCSFCPASGWLCGGPSSRGRSSATAGAEPMRCGPARRSWTG